MLDVTCELPLQLAPPAYLNLAVWDTHAPTPAQIDQGVQWAMQQRAAGRPILVHCAHGHGRSATVLGAILIGEAGGATCCCRVCCRRCSGCCCRVCCRCCSCCCCCYGPGCWECGGSACQGLWLPPRPAEHLLSPCCDAAEGVAKGAADAEAVMKAERPRVRLNRRQRAALKQWVAEREGAKQE